MTDHLLEATANAVGHAKARRADEITPDDLLLGALQAVARLEVACLGPLSLDLSDHPRAPAPGAAVETGPRYSEATAQIFDEASALARMDGESRVRIVHLLAAFRREGCELLRDLQEQHAFDDTDWRAALARWDGPSNGERGTAAGGSLLSVEEAAEELGVHHQTVRGYIRSGKLQAYRIAGERAIRVFSSDLYGLLEPLEPSTDEEQE